jgi:hypothetical protein
MYSGFLVSVSIFCSGCFLNSVGSVAFGSITARMQRYLAIFQSLRLSISVNDSTYVRGYIKVSSSIQGFTKRPSTQGSFKESSSIPGSGKDCNGSFASSLAVDGVSLSLAELVERCLNRPAFRPTFWLWNGHL